MGSFQRRLLKVVLRVVERPKLTLAIAGAVLLACGTLAFTRLSISTDEDQLFSSKVKFFHDYLEFDKKFPENQALYVIVEPPDQAHLPPVKRWAELSDRLAEKLRPLTKYVEQVDNKVPVEKLGAQGILLEDPKNLKGEFADVQRLAPLAQLLGEKPNAATALLAPTPIQRFLAGVSLQQPDAETAGFVKLLADSWTDTLKHPAEPLQVGRNVPDLAAAGADDPSRLGYYYTTDESDPSRHLMLVRVYTRDNFNSLDFSEESVAAIRSTVEQVAKNYPEFQVGITGRPALDADEMQTTDRDTNRAEVLAATAVFLGLAFTLRSIWLALVAEISLGVGIGWTFGWATISVGQLNLLSIVFLIALIGIGMDYLIQILTRYRREARRYPRPQAVWARVFRYVSPPIMTACFGAAGAFFVSVFTDFRGAADLGIIAGGGLLLCLLAGYTVLPALLVLFPPKLEPVDPEARYATPSPPRSAFRRLALPAIWVVALLALLPWLGKANFNPNLLDLQAPNLPSVKLVRKLQTWSAVELSPDLNLLRRVRDAVEKAPTVASTESILTAYDNYDWLKQHQRDLPTIHWAEPAPVTADNLAALGSQATALADHFAKAAGAAEFSGAATSLRGFAEALSSADPNQAAGRLSDWQVKFVAELRGMLEQFNPQPPNVAALPPEIRGHLLSDDGYYALYIYPKEQLWKREPLGAFVTDVEAHVLQVPGAPDPTGIAPDIYHSTRSIERSFYRATGYALALVLVLVLLDLRSIPLTLLTVSVLALGLPMLVALMGLLGVDWNFANFFGLPILIGAGHEYGVFMVHRYKESLHNPRRVWGRWDVSDRALLLCAFVTSSSFGFFWALGHHRGLMSLGLVMATGTACIYLAAVMVVRPLLKWKIERAKLYQPPEPKDEPLETVGSRKG